MSPRTDLLRDSGGRRGFRCVHSQPARPRLRPGVRHICHCGWDGRVDHEDDRGRAETRTVAARVHDVEEDQDVHAVRVDPCVADLEPVVRRGQAVRFYEVPEKDVQRDPRVTLFVGLVTRRWGTGPEGTTGGSFGRGGPVRTTQTLPTCHRRPGVETPDVRSPDPT